LIQSIEFGSRKETVDDIQRLDEYHELAMDARRKQENELLEKQQRDMLSKGLSSTSQKITQPPVKIKRKRTLAETAVAVPVQAKAESQSTDSRPTESTVLGLLGDYESD